MNTLRRWFSALDSFIASFGTSLENLAQVGHTAVSYGLVFTAFVIGAKHGLPWVGCIVAALLAGFAFWKEYARDPLPPENAPWKWNGVRDFSFYLLGITLAVTAYYAGVR